MQIDDITPHPTFSNNKVLMRSDSIGNNTDISGALSLSSLNIGGNNESNEENNICANCGKEGGDNIVNTCNKCDLVQYCNAACKKKHRSKHKKKCDKRV